MRLHRLHILGQERLLDPRDQTLVRQIDPVDLDLGRLLVQQVVELFLGVLTDRLAGVEETGAFEDTAVPAVHAVAGDGERTLVERQAPVIQRRQVEVGHRAHALAARTHAAGDVEAAPLLHGLPAPFERDRTRSADGGDVEGERLGRADVRLAEPAEEDAQHRVGVGGGADRGAGICTHPLLVDDDRGRQPVQYVDIRARQRRHEALDEGAVGLVDQPLRLRGDRAEHQGALARARDAGEHGEPALRELDADVLEVVLSRAVHADQIVAVGNLRRRRLPVRPRGRAHRFSICYAGARLGAFRRRRLARSNQGRAAPLGLLRSNASCDSLTRASRFLIVQLTCFATVRLRGWAAAPRASQPDRLVPPGIELAANRAHAKQ